MTTATLKARNMHETEITPEENQARRETRRQRRRGPGPGLNKKRRIDWTLPENILAQILSHYGLSADAIGRYTGLATGAIHYRNRKQGVRLTDYRRGEGPVIQRIIARYSVKSIGTMSADEQAELAKRFEVELL